MKRFEIEVIRVGYAGASIEVEAETLEEAKVAAVDQAGDHEFGSGHHAEYFAEEDLPELLPAGHTTISPVGKEYLETIFGYIRDNEANHFEESCSSSGVVEDGHILYATLLAELAIEGSVEWEGTSVSSEAELRKLMAKLYAPEEYKDIIAKEEV